MKTIATQPIVWLNKKLNQALIQLLYVGIEAHQQLLWLRYGDSLQNGTESVTLSPQYVVLSTPSYTVSHAARGLQ